MTGGSGGRGGEGGDAHEVEARARRWLARASLPASCGLELLAGDASDRRFVRVRPDGSPSRVLVVHTGPIDPAALPLLQVADLFRRLPVPVPAVLDTDADLGIVVLEDLGTRRSRPCSPAFRPRSMTPGTGTRSRSSRRSSRAEAGWRRAARPGRRRSGWRSTPRSCCGSWASFWITSSPGTGGTPSHRRRAARWRPSSAPWPARWPASRAFSATATFTAAT